MSDTPSRVERLLNLLACLLDTRVPIPQDEIVRQVSGYPESKSAYRRAFERDKEALRAMGVPIQVATPDFADANEVGYRVDPDEYYLPDLGLDENETAALNVAINAVSLHDIAGRGALMKLGGQVVNGAQAPPIASLPLVPALAPLFDAYRRHHEISFGYRGVVRRVQPWAIASRSGRWYVVGHDCDRDAIRTFRADRIDGDLTSHEDTSFEVPADFEPDDYLRDEPWTWGDGPRFDADVLVDDEHAPALLGAASDASVVERRDGEVVVRIPAVDRPSLRTLVLGFLDHVEVLEPRSLRDEVIEWLEAQS